MTSSMQDIARVVFIGVGATVVMDLWLWLLKRLNVPGLNFALVGRWIGHVLHGRWSHPAIGKAAPVKGELALGWVTHYTAGVVFAGVLASVWGMAWVNRPSLLPALCLGLATVVVPLFVMQPAMGAGVASCKTATPVRNCTRSVANHAVFGLGLYLSAVGLEWISLW